MRKTYRLMVMVFILIAFINGNVYAENFKNIVVISIDALHPDALQRAKILNLKEMMRTGAYTLSGHSTDPPKTLIAHAAMFTGLAPEVSGKVDNDWVPGEATVQKSTIFDYARANGYQTGYFYSKEKLGYLSNSAIDVHEWSRDNAIDLAEAFIKTPGRHFVFLHINGLDEVGPQTGWLSPEYLEELSFIDDYLSSLIQLIKNDQEFILIVTSDHAGHARIHGSRHPEDFRLPLIICSDAVSVERFQNIPFSVTNLKKMLETLYREVSPKNLSKDVLIR